MVLPSPPPQDEDSSASSETSVEAQRPASPSSEDINTVFQDAQEEPDMPITTKMTASALEQMSVFGAPDEEPPEDEDEDNFKRMLADAKLHVMTLKTVPSPPPKRRWPSRAWTWTKTILQTIFTFLMIWTIIATGTKEVYVHQQHPPRNKVYVKVIISEKPFSALLDTGAETCCMSEDLYRKLPGPYEDATNQMNNIIDGNGRVVQQATLPKLLPMTIGNVTTYHPVAIIRPSNDQNIFVLGMCLLNSEKLSLLHLDSSIVLKRGDPFGSSPLIPTSPEPFDLEIKIESEPSSCNIARADTDIEIPPFETVSVSCSLPPNHSALPMLCPMPENELAPFVVKNRVAKIRKDSLQLELKNLNLFPVKIPKSATLAKLTNVDPLPDILEAPGFDFNTKFDLQSYLTKNLKDQDMLGPLLQLLDSFSDTISKHEFDIGSLKLDMRMDIETTSEAPVSSKPYFLDIIRSDQVEKHLEIMVDYGLMVKCASAWTSPGFIIPRSAELGQGIRIRLVVDYRRLNLVTVKDRFPLPPIKYLLHQISQGVLFSLIDLRSAFHSIFLTESASHKAAIITPTAIYRPVRMMFGLANAPSHFARVIREVLHDLVNVIYFQDDILIVTRTDSKVQHLKDIEMVLTRLRKFGLKINGKGQFFLRSIRFLGKIVSGAGMSPLPSHVETLRSFPPPKTLKQTQKFLGLLAWLSAFIQNYSKKISPFTAMLSSKEFTWTEELLQNFEALKREISTNSFIYFPDYDEPFYLASDICKDSYASILYQVKTYSKEDLPQLEAGAGDVNNFPSSTVPTCHPVLPGPGKGVPPNLALQATDGQPSTKTHLLALNKGDDTLTTVMKTTDTVQHVRVVSFSSGVFFRSNGKLFIVRKRDGWSASVGRGLLTLSSSVTYHLSCHRLPVTSMDIAFEESWNIQN